MKKRTLHLMVLMLSFGLSGTIVRYYWLDDSLEGMKDVPEYIMVLALIYVFLQIIRRRISAKQEWWDWLYYLGLLAMILPNMLATASHLIYYNYLTDFGTLFLIIPVLIEGNYQLKRK